MDAQPNTGRKAGSSSPLGQSVLPIPPLENHSKEFPKTLIVDLAQGYGGVTSRVLALMLNSPRDRIALAGLEGGAVVQQALQLGLCVYPLGKRKTDLRILPRLVHIIRQEGFEVVDTQNIQAKFWASLATLLTRFALVSTIHSWYASEHGKTSIKGRLYTTLELLTNPRLNLYISVSKKDRQSLDRAGFREELVRLIYNTVSIDPEKIGGDSTWLKQKFNLAPDAIVCTAVGRLVPIKGYEVLIEAMKRIAAEVPQLVVLILGEGPSKAELQEQIGRSNLQGRIHLAGYQDRASVLSIVKSSDIFAMPSHYEGTPIALLEAAALARPILASDTGGIPELVENCEHALLVPPGDAQALGEGLVRLAKDREFAHILGLSAQSRVQQYFNLEKQLTETWDAYRTARNRRFATV